MDSNFSPREFLRQRNELLVHFSTVMSNHSEFGFPEDIEYAMALRGKALSFSTIFVGATAPHFENGLGGAEGSVGLLIDIGPKTVIESVLWCDSGSNDLGSGGKKPTAQNCAESIDKRKSSNEWTVRDYVPVGIFILCPIWVPQVSVSASQLCRVEVPINLNQAIEPFPGKPIFTAGNSSFEKYADGEIWKQVTYNEIIPA